MGNANNAFGYEATSTQEYCSNNCWELSEGISKEDKEKGTGTKIALFRFSKVRVDRLTLAQRHVQKLKSLRHPFILSFLDSMETDEAVVLVSEACVPLESWLKTVSRETDSTNAQEIAVLEGMIVWGLKCLLQALNFLHDNCRLLHGNIGMHAIFVTPSGDWKLSAMEIACNAAQGDDFSIFEKYQHILDKPFASPERSSAFSMSKEVPHFVDIYSLGHCMQRCFDSLNMEISKALVRYSFTLAVLRAYLRHELFFVRVLSQMTAVEWKRRPKADSLVKAPMFRSDHILLLESISELSLRPSAEILDILKGIEPKLSDISKSICSHKVLPSITKTLQIALNDFSNRDSREACRQSVQLSIGLIGKMAIAGKVEVNSFQMLCLPIVLQLWSMNDRTVRTVMLSSLKQLCPSSMIPASAINKHIFDHMLAGFSDSSANIAGLKTSCACIKLMEVNQIATKLMPNACLLLTDKNKDVRTLSLALLDVCVQRIKLYHQHLDAQRQQPEPGSESIDAQASSSGWTSALSLSGANLFDGLSRKLSEATVLSPPQKGASDNAAHFPLIQPQLEHSSNTSLTSNKISFEELSSPGTIDGKQSIEDSAWDNGESGWGDDDLDDLDVGDWDSSANKANPAAEKIDSTERSEIKINSLQSAKETVSPMDLPAKNLNLGLSGKEKVNMAKPKLTTKEAKRVSVQKLAVDPNEHDDWDDF